MGTLPTKVRPDAPPARPFGGEDPFALLHARMDELFSDFFREGWVTPLAAPAGAWTEWPRLDVSCDATVVKVVAEVPGMDEKDLEITLEDGALVLAGEKKAEKEEKGDQWVRRERSFGSFRRVVRLPADVVADRAEARFAQGVVTVTLPRVVDASKKPRRIEVRPGA